MLVSKTVLLLLPVFMGYYLGDIVSGVLFGAMIFFLLRFNGSLEYLGWEYWHH